MVGMSSNVIQPLPSRMQYPVWEKVLKSSGINEDEIQMIVEKIKLAYISWNKNAFPGAIGNVFRSIDGGEKWHKFSTGAHIITYIAIDPTSPTNLYIGTNFGLVKSTNGGGN